MPSRLFRAALCASLGLSSAAAAQATHYYVDPVLGSNSGDGSALAPWKTITHALVASSPSVFGASRFFHLAPGTYDSAGGEVFPLQVPPGVSLLGAGRTRTILSGSGALAGGVPVDALVIPSSAQFTPTSGKPILSSLALRDATRGVMLFDVPSSQGLFDLSFEGLSTGVDLLSGNTYQLRVRNSRFSDCDIGVSVSGYSTTALLEDCVLENCGTGLRIFPSANGFVSASTAILRRSQVRGAQTAFDLRSSFFVAASGVVENSLIADAGLLARASSNDAYEFIGTYLSLRSSTVVNVASFADASPLALFGFETAASILWNCGLTAGLDPDVFLFATETDADVLLPGNGNLSVDPLFDGAFPGQYRLAANSPVLDTVAPPSSGSAGNDFEGDPRLLDADGNGVALSDMGWDERTRLQLVAAAPASIGQSLSLTTHGPTGLPACLLLSAGLAPTQIDLGNWLMVDLPSALFLSCGLAPTSLSLLVPAQADLVGQFAHFQAAGIDGGTIVTSNLLSALIH